MVAMYLAASGSTDLIGMAIVLAVVAGLGAFGSPRGRKCVLVLAVLLVLAYTTGVFAQPYPIPCDPLWRLLGWC
jgi:hypothetical protein